ncbi:HNH endonuclease signature motif containing protein, partial [Actinokineospora sp.]|uniref:HNH endonuclease signature motif containing protein n=1 Tax=Actinokineospora sp. TaxID=1872133 RepID=UPI003D6B7EF7
ACDSAVIPYVMGGATRPLDIGRMRYTIPTHLRRALILRDQGCAFPGCDRRPRSCHGHQSRHWAHGGPTALDNLVLLCGQHHRLIHNSDWAVTIVDGLPEFTPPAYLDPYRRPLPATPRHSAA